MGRSVLRSAPRLVRSAVPIIGVERVREQPSKLLQLTGGAAFLSVVLCADEPSDCGKRGPPAAKQVAAPPAPPNSNSNSSSMWGGQIPMVRSAASLAAARCTTTSGSFVVSSQIVCGSARSIRASTSRMFAGQSDELPIAELVDGLCEEAGAAFTWDELLFLQTLEDDGVVLLRDQHGGSDGDLEVIHLLS